MQAEKLVLTMAQKKKAGGDYWYTKPGSIRFTQNDILEKLRAGVEIEFINGDEVRELFGILSLVEKGSTSGVAIDFTRKGDTALLNRIIRNGGFIEYIENLELNLNYEG